MSITFTCTGHENMRAEHSKTFEFTKDNFLTPRGDCIIGINASELPKAMEGTIEITVEVGKYSWKSIAQANPNFTSNHEMVIRRSGFLDERTFAIRGDKVALDLPREIVELLKNPKQNMNVTVTQK